MIVRNTCFAEFCLLSVLLIFPNFEKLLSAQSEICKSDNEICQPLSQCQWYKGLSRKPLSSLTWCNITDYVVCCPQATILTNKPSYYKNITEAYTKDCKKWQEKIYPKCPPEGLIVAGKRAIAKEFPHMALLGIKEQNNYKWTCGGSLINERYVLTAAHCLETQETNIPNRVRLGELDYSTSDDDALVQEFAIKDYTTHREYNPEEDYNDIALVELDGIAEINSYVVPICLPATSGSENVRLYTAGWGAVAAVQSNSQYLQKVTLERFDEVSCQVKVGQPQTLPDGLRPEHQICAGSFDDKRDSCQGDSGGPLFIEHADIRCMYVIHGITSFGYTCGQAGIPGVYARVYPYVEWITSVAWNTTLPSS